jgi:hypothetical protein
MITVNVSVTFESVLSYMFNVDTWKTATCNIVATYHLPQQQEYKVSVLGVEFVKGDHKDAELIMGKLLAMFESKEVFIGDPILSICGTSSKTKKIAAQKVRIFLTKQKTPSLL